MLLFIFAALILRTGITNTGITTDLLRNYFYPQWREKKPEGWLIVFADNPDAHSLDTEEWLKWWLEHKVVFIAIPANLSHLLDPLDLSTFFYIKADMKKIQRVINLIHANAHDTTYQLDPITLSKIAVPPNSTLQRANSLQRCLGFENKSTVRTRILLAEFVLRRIQASKWKVLKGFTDAGIQPFDPDRVLAKCGLQHPIPAAVPVDAPPAPVLTSAQAAEQLRSIAKLQFDDPVHRIRVMRDTLDQVVSTRPTTLSPEQAETALRQLSDPRLSDFDVLSVAEELCSIVVTPRKAARLHSEQIEEDLKKAAVPVDGLAPKLHRKNLSYQEGIKSVSQVKSLQAANAPSDKSQKRQHDNASMKIRLRLLPASIARPGTHYEIVSSNVTSVEPAAVLDSLPTMEEWDAAFEAAPSSASPTHVSKGLLLSPSRLRLSPSHQSVMTLPSIIGVPRLTVAFSSPQKLQKKRNVASLLTQNIPDVDQPAKRARSSSSATVPAPHNSASQNSAIGNLCEKYVCFGLLMDKASSVSSIFLKLQPSLHLASYLLAAHLVVFQLKFSLYGSCIKDFIHSMIPNDVDVTVPRDITLAHAVEQLKTVFALSRRFNFVQLETKGQHVARVHFASDIFMDPVIVELVHTHHWTDQEGCQVDVDINNLRLILKDVTATKLTLEIRLHNQPAGSTVDSILENIIDKKFIVVKHNKNRIAKLVQRGYSQKNTKKKQNTSN